MKAERASRWIQACRWGALLILGLGYAVLAHRAAASSAPDLQGALVAIAPLFSLAFMMAWRSPRRTALLVLLLGACSAAYRWGDWLVAHYNWVFLLQHAGTYALLGAAFGRTLQRDQTPMVSRFAAIAHAGSLSPALMRYTRAVTWAWTLYFGGTAALSLLLFWLAPVPVWSAFANLLGIPLLVLMFVGEYAVRCCVLPAAERTGPLDAIRAYRQAASQDKARRT